MVGHIELTLQTLEEMRAQTAASIQFNQAVGTSSNVTAGLPNDFSFIKDDAPSILERSGSRRMDDSGNGPPRNSNMESDSFFGKSFNVRGSSSKGSHRRRGDDHGDAYDHGGGGGGGSGSGSTYRRGRRRVDGNDASEETIVKTRRNRGLSGAATDEASKFSYEDDDDNNLFRSPAARVSPTSATAHNHHKNFRQSVDFTVGSESVARHNFIVEGSVSREDEMFESRKHTINRTDTGTILDNSRSARVEKLHFNNIHGLPKTATVSDIDDHHTMHSYSVSALQRPSSADSGYSSGPPTARRVVVDAVGMHRFTPRSTPRIGSTPRVSQSTPDRIGFASSNPAAVHPHVRAESHFTYPDAVDVMVANATSPRPGAGQPPMHPPPPLRSPNDSGSFMVTPRSRTAAVAAALIIPDDSSHNDRSEPYPQQRANSFDDSRATTAATSTTPTRSRKVYRSEVRDSDVDLNASGQRRVFSAGSAGRDSKESTLDRRAAPPSPAARDRMNGTEGVAEMHQSRSRRPSAVDSAAAVAYAVGGSLPLAALQQSDSLSELCQHQHMLRPSSYRDDGIRSASIISVSPQRSVISARDEVEDDCATVYSSYNGI